MSISNKLSPQSNLLRFAKNAEDQIAVLRSKGLASEADQFEKILQRKVADKDPSIMDTFGQLDQIYGANLRTSKGAADKDVEAVPDLPVIADRIQDALRLGEDSNIRVSPVLIQNAFEAEIGGDAAGAFRAAKSIEKEIEEQRKQQVEEEKEIKTLADGSQVREGKKTGTRYSLSGIPLSSGPINTGIYNKVVEQFTGVPQQLAQPTTTIQASPQVYEKPVQQAPSRIQEAFKAFEDARVLAEQGDLAGAANLVNAIRQTELFGMPVTADNVRDLLISSASEQPQQDGKPQAENARKPGESLADWRKRTGR